MVLNDFAAEKAEDNFLFNSGALIGGQCPYFLSLKQRLVYWRESVHDAG